ncbi:putative UPF0481 protein At3g02645 [Jatropha curcas]|uniref:putative UPF0481 protein At3g02645 n=1 Tax=Jatropha curcas TaxID=180498 RepID=UPI0018930D4C|nr:putative UPF0481 protein At3g02645 [Jatropha curcas]
MEQQNNIFDIELLSLCRRLESKLVNKSPMSLGSCIYRVPSTLRKHNEHLFEPNFISIGPYHRINVEKFQFTERIKLWYLNCIIARAPIDTSGKTRLQSFVESIRPHVKRCRECYSEEVQIQTDDDEFIEMMIIDGCFLIELFRRFAKIVQPSEDDPLFKLPWLPKILMTELLLLENQLPWFVLHRLFDLTKVDHGAETRSLVELVQHFFFWNALRAQSIGVNSSMEYKHLLDVQGNIILSGSDDAGGYFLRIPCVTDLLKAGIDFTVGEKTKLVKIIFENGILTIPPLVILENAESLFRNLIAYEQCDRSLRDRITGYAAFLDNLIKSSEDLEYLKKKGIVYFYLSAEDISNFFNRLYKDADLVNYTYRKLSEDVNAYCESLWPRWRAMLLRDYLNNPWSTMAFIAATVILVLTFLQTLYAILYH